jgi:two-component sensor histidine kinase
LALSTHPHDTDRRSLRAPSRGLIEEARDSYRMTWRESGGPPVSGPPKHSGFGTAIAARSVGKQLGGTIEHEWAETGLVATLEVPVAKMTR